MLKVFGFFFCTLTLSVSATAKNLQLIDKSDTGFAIYRSGTPSANDLRQMCSLGITEIAVLSGDADVVEKKLQSHCPTLKVVYNVRQNARVTLTAKFIESFDTWVQDAQKKGKKIAFRCSCGCHRTGRLAAYYQMKYQNKTFAEAIQIMNQYGKMMWMFPELKPQVRGMSDYIHKQPCAVLPRFCVQ
ncbi:MAG: dual specificity protein phosphatase family protein [Bdellovibrionales bacterium]